VELLAERHDLVGAQTAYRRADERGHDELSEMARMLVNLREHR
jgi:hypothetical protein